MLKNIYLTIFLLTLPLFACDNSDNEPESKIIPLVQVASSANLEKLAEQLKQGMLKINVEKILGMPDYSPIDGLYYYSAKNSPSLIIDYRNQQDEITNKLQLFWLAEVEE